MGREILKMSINWVANYKITINDHFWGGFAVDADFSDAFSGCIEGPFFKKISKNR
jgi:hypothetical protein